MPSTPLNLLRLILASAAALWCACGSDGQPAADAALTATDGADTPGCPAPTVEIKPGVCAIKGGAANAITADLTLKADTAWVLQGGVFVGDDQNQTVLTIEPGTTIYGDTGGTSPSFLTIRRGSRIEAAGPADKPIVFTSGARSEEAHV